MNDEYPSTEKNNQSNTNLLLGIAIGIILVLTLVVIVLVFLLSQNETDGQQAFPIVPSLPEAVQQQPMPDVSFGDVTDEPTPTIMPEDEKENWLNFISSKYGYSFMYPPIAEIEPAEMNTFSLTPQEYQDGVTIEEKYNQYTGDICVTVNYGIGYVKVIAPPNHDFSINMCGMRTGVGAQCTIDNKTEQVEVAGQMHQATGQKIVCTDGGVTDIHEELHVSLSDGTTVIYGTIMDDSDSQQQYNETRETLLDILSTLGIN